MFATLVLAATLTGSYPTGFDVIEVRDMSRPDITSSTKGRPVQINVWYPSAGAASNPMKFREYVNLLGRYEGVPRTSATDKVGIERFVETTRSRSQGTSSIDEHLPKILNTTVRAYREATPARGKFPLVLFPEYRAPATNSFIAEALASHGFVVMSVPMIGTFELDFDSGVSGMETLVADMRLAVHESARLTFVDPSRLAVMGVGIAANAGVAYATRNPDVDAIISLEGGLPSPFENSILQRTPYFDPAILRAPMLIIQAPFEGRDDSLLEQYLYADRWHVEFPSMKEFYFLNYGALEANFPKILGQPPGDVANGFEWGVQYVRAFLDTTLGGKKDAIAKLGTPKEGLLQTRFEKAKPPVPTYVELKRIIEREGAPGIRATFERLKTTVRQPFSRRMVFDLAAHFGYEKDNDWAIRRELMSVLSETHPDSARAHFALGNACRARRETACAIAAYEETLRLLPSDSDSMLDAATRERIVRLATERRDELRTRQR